MIPALIILTIVIAVGLLLYISHRLTHHDRQQLENTNADNRVNDSTDNTDEQCCGMHITCERDSLLTAIGDDPEYFDDEELDQYAGIPADGYNPDQIEQFTDILLTLRPDDIAPWACAIQRRGITLPSSVRDQLLMIVAEERQKRTQ